MKKSIILLLGMVCAITACHEAQLEEVRVDNCSSHHFCIETSFPSLEADNAETRSSIQPKITLKWSDGDLISVVNLTTGKNLLGDLVARVDDDQVYFEGDLSGSVRTGDKLAAIYPSQNYSSISNITDISFDLSNQTCSSMNEVPFFAYSLFTCESVGIVNVQSPFVIPVSFNQIAISNIEPNTKIEYIELSNVGNSLLFNVNKSSGTLDLTSTTGKVRIIPEAKYSGDDGSLFAYCALAESKASERSIVVKALPNIYTAEWAKSAMSTSKYYTSIASDFTTTEYKDFMVSEPSSLEVGAEGGKLIFIVSSNNKEWTASSIPDLDIAPSSGSNCENLEVVVNVPKNDGYAEKTYMITFEAADYKYIYTVKQDVLPSNKRIEFPDMNLKRYLLNNYDLDEDGGINEEEAANITMVSCPNKQIADLTGLEKCKNITTINCSGNYINEIRLPGLTKLSSLICYGNPIEVLDLSNCSALKVLNMQNNTDNAIVGDELKLSYYDQSESLTIDVTNTIINRIYVCRSNTLAYLDVSKNTHLTQLSAYVNPNLTSIDVSKLVQLEVLDLGDCSFTNLDVSQNILLTKLFVTNNKLSTLNVSQNKQLQVLKCNGNQISNLKILNNTLLETLDVRDNQLSAINVRNNTALKDLRISNNTDISLLDLKSNTVLETLYADGLSITAIDLVDNSCLSVISLTDNTLLTHAYMWDDFNSYRGCLYVNHNFIFAKGNGTVLRESYVIGSYVTPIGDTQSGVICMPGYVMSISEANRQWSSQKGKIGATSLDDGMANRKALESVVESNASADLNKFHAFKYCMNFGQDWYLPALNELMKIYSNVSELNAMLTKIGGTILDGTYWSSTEYDSYDAYYVQFSNGKQNYTDKDFLNSATYQSLKVRAIRAL